VLVEGDLVTGNILANLNGNCSRGLGPKQAKVKKIDAKLDLEWKKTRSALKDLADLETKLAKLDKLSDKHGLKVSKLQTALRANQGRKLPLRMQILDLTMRLRDPMIRLHQRFQKRWKSS
jgi:hypothetical protein